MWRGRADAVSAGGTRAMTGWLTGSVCNAKCMHVVFTCTAMLPCACCCYAAGDRGGVADLINTIKMSKIPIICICNDKYAQKLRSLRNHVSPCLPIRCFQGTQGSLLTPGCSYRLSWCALRFQCDAVASVHALLQHMPNRTSFRENTEVPATHTTTWPILHTYVLHPPTNLRVCVVQCLELDFRKPQSQQIAARMAMVCQQEGLDTNEATLRTLIEGGQGDLRLVLGQLQVSGRSADRAGPAVPSYCSVWMTVSGVW